MYCPNNNGFDTSLTIPANEVVKPCCQRNKNQSKIDLLSIIEKASAIALGILSAYISWKLFVPFFFVGVVIGLCSEYQGESSCGNSASSGSCAQSQFEQSTKVKLPRLVIIATNFAMSAHHVEHHSEVYVPVTGIYLGAWFVKVYWETLGFKKINQHLSKFIPSFL